MARALIWLVRKYTVTKTWVHVPKEAPRGVVRTNQISTLKHWGLIEQKPHAAGKSKKSGYWRPLELAIPFVAGTIKVPSHVWTYNDKLEKSSDVLVDIYKCLGTDYNYSELMRASLDGDDGDDERTN
jgi:hypothetical protein